MDRSPGVGWTLLFRSLTVPLLGSVPSCCLCFTLSCLFSLADASTAYADVSRHNTTGIMCRLMRFVFVTVSYPCHIVILFETDAIATTPVDLSLVMRALGGAITSPCSNDSGVVLAWSRSFARRTKSRKERGSTMPVRLIRMIEGDLPNGLVGAT